MGIQASRPQKGFSLLEGIVVIGIISVILGMTMLNYSVLVPNHKADSAMDQVLTQLRSARERAISHRIEVQVEFLGTNQMRFTEIWRVGNAPPPTTVTWEGAASYMVFFGTPAIPDTPMGFGNGGAIFFEGIDGGPPTMKFTSNGSFIDGGNTLVNGTIFLGIPGKPSTARAVTILGATGRVRQYHWDGTRWQE